MKIVRILQNEIRLLEKIQKNPEPQKRILNPGKFKRTIPEHSKEDIELAEQKEEISRLENILQNSVEYEKKAKRKNNSEFFRPIKETIEITKKTLEIKPVDSLLLDQVLSTYPRQYNKDYILNSAKAFCENGEVYSAIDSLEWFIQVTSDEDYRKKKIVEFLQYDKTNNTGKIGEFKFTILEDDIELEGIGEKKSLLLPYEYRIPVDLKIQSYNKIPELGELSALQYELLTEIHQEGDTEKIYEILLPFKYLPNFLDSFIDFMEIEKFRYEYLIDLDRLLVEFNILEHKLKVYNYSMNGPENISGKFEEIFPIMRAYVGAEKEDLFIKQFSIFVERFILPQVGLKELLYDRKEKYESMIAKIENEVEYEASYFNSIDVAEFLGNTAGLYANLHVWIYNIENNIETPFKTEQKIIYMKAYNKYLDFYGDIYKKYKFNIEQIMSKSNSIQEEKELLLKKISNRHYRKDINEEWEYVLQNLNTDKRATMLGIRGTLEILAKAHFEKIGGTIRERHSLAEQFNDLNNYISNKKIYNLIYDLRDTSNKIIHKEKTNSPKYSSLKPYSSKDIYKDYKEILSHYINFIGL